MWLPQNTHVVCLKGLDMQDPISTGLFSLVGCVNVFPFLSPPDVTTPSSHFTSHDLYISNQRSKMAQITVTVNPVFFCHFFFVLLYVFYLTPPFSPPLLLPPTTPLPSVLGAATVWLPLCTAGTGPGH